MIGRKFPAAFGLIAIAFICGSALAQMPNFKPITVPPSTESPVGMQELDSEPDSYPATYIPNVEYVRRGDRALKLQILLPRDGPPRIPGVPANATPAPRRPLIVYVQGSGWGPQDIYSALPQLSDLAHHGFVVASVEHRPSTEAVAPAQIQDVKTAIRFLRANATKYEIDPERIGIWGDSSGGHVAAIVGTTHGVPEFATSDYPDQSDAVRAVVDFFGVSDLTKLGEFPSWLEHDAEGSPGSLMLGGSPLTNRDKALANSPVSYISRERDIPPFLIIHGDGDVIVPFNQSVLLYEALRNAGKDVSFYKLKGGNHGWRFWSPRVVKLVRDFFDDRLKP